ncbi:MAG: CHASE3 domain-containing protein [Acidobacteriaceae bacterium]|jgi:PAS domain S-box-containing protein
MTIHKRFSGIRRSTVFSGFVMLLAALVANTVIMRIQLGLQIRNQVRVTHSRQVLSELGETELLLKDVEIIQFSLLYTDDPRYLTPYSAVISQLRPQMQRLEEVTADDPQQQGRVLLLRKLVDNKLAQIAQTILLDKSGKSKEATALILSDSVLNTTRDIEHIVDSMEQDELALQASRSAISQRSIRLTVASIYLTNLLLLIGIILLAQHTRNEMRARDDDALELRKRQRNLFEIQERLRLAQDVAGMGTFDLEIPSGKQTWSERTLEIFGCAPHTHQPEPEELMERVHPGDRSLVAEKLEEAMTGKRVQAEYRILPGDGKVRWVEISGRGIFDNTGEANRYLGVVYDITERKLAEEKLHRSEDQLHALTGRLQTAIESERLRIAQELHDQLGQALTCIKMDLDWIVRKHGAGGDVWVSMVHDAMRVVDSNIALVRRIATELRPQLLDSMGLRAAIEWEIEQFQRRSGVRCVVRLTEHSLDLSNEKNIAVFRIFQEAMTNIARHADAKNICVDLEREHDDVVLKFQDDGIGFSSDLMEQMQSLGLLGMYERALVMGAHLEIKSKPNQGTAIILRVPSDKSGIIAAEPHEDINR